MSPMQTRSPIFQQSIRPRTFESGPWGYLKYNRLHDYLQNAAADHAEDLGVSFDFLKPRGLAWIISRFHIQIERAPFMDEEFSIETWPSQLQRLYAIREWRVLGQEGAPMAAATSAWLLVNAKNWRPCRPERHLPDFPTYNLRMVEDSFPRLPDLHSEDEMKHFQVRMHDLDLNRHVNNAVYLEWALESVPEKIWNEMRLAEVECAFNGMAFYGDNIVSRISLKYDNEDARCIHLLQRQSDGKELTRLVTRWKACA